MSSASPNEEEIDLSRLQRFLGYQLTRVKVHVHKIFLHRLASWNLMATEFSVLLLVEANPGIYLRQLGSALDISPPNLVPVVERLVSREVLMRLPSPNDRRLQQLYLTDAGKQLLQQAEAEVKRFEAALDQSLTATERKYLASALKKLIAFQETD